MLRLNHADPAEDSLDRQVFGEGLDVREGMQVGGRCGRRVRGNNHMTASHQRWLLDEVEG